MEQQVFETAFHATAKDPADTARKVARAQLMMQIEDIIRRQGWTEAEAARRCGVTQPRINLLLKHQFHKFSLDSLVRMAAPRPADRDRAHGHTRGRVMQPAVRAEPVCPVCNRPGCPPGER